MSDPGHSIQNADETVPCKREERLLDTLVDLRRGLHEFDAQFVRELPALLLRDSTLLGPVGFVADEDLVDTLRCVLLDVGVPCADVWRGEGREGGGNR